MRYTLAALLIPALTFGAGSPLQASEWKEPTAQVQRQLQAKDNHAAPSPVEFSISIPGKPAIQSRTTNLAGQNLDWDVFRGEEGDELYVLAYTDLALGEVNAGGSALVASIAENLLSEVDLDALKEGEREIFLGIHPGREFLGVINDNVVAARLYIVGERLYALFSRAESMQSIDSFFSSFQARPVWNTVTSEMGSFQVQTPVEPITETYTSDFGQAPLNWTALRADGSIYGESSNEAEDIYVVAYTDLPAGALQLGSEALLEQFSQSVVKRLGLEAKLGNNSRSIGLADNPGREMLGIATDRVTAARVYLVGQRVYVLFTMAETMADANQFLNSFALQ